MSEKPITQRIKDRLAAYTAMLRDIDNQLERLDRMEMTMASPPGPDLTGMPRGSGTPSDRTGMMVAIYRIVVQNWDKETALAEMAQGGYGFHTIWSNLQGYITHLDVAQIKQQVNDAKAAQQSPH